MKINITGDYSNLLDKLKQIDNTYYITEEDALRVHISNNKPDNHVHVWQKVHDNKVTDPYSYYEKLKQDDLEYNVGLSFKSDLGENNIINLKSEIKKWLTEKINVFGLYKHEYYNKQEDFQFKVGLGVKL